MKGFFSLNTRKVKISYFRTHIRILILQPSIVFFQEHKILQLYYKKLKSFELQMELNFEEAYAFRMELQSTQK